MRGPRGVDRPGGAVRGRLPIWSAEREGNAELRHPGGVPREGDREVLDESIGIDRVFDVEDHIGDVALRRSPGEELVLPVEQVIARVERDAIGHSEILSQVRSSVLSNRY